MSSLTTVIRQWRHIRGYGVHSPYAFMLTTEILSLPRGYSYYHDGQVLKLQCSRTVQRLISALLRYAWRFGFSKFDNAGHDEVWQQFPSLAGEITADGARICVVADSAALSAARLDGVVLASYGKVKAQADWIRKNCVAGVLFYSERALLYFSNPAVRFVAYEYRF